MPFYPDLNNFEGIAKHLLKAEKVDNIKYVTTKNSSHIIGKNNWGDSNKIFNDYTDYPNCWASENIPFSNVTIYFHHYKVKMTNYSILSRNDQRAETPRGWNIYGSNNNVSWTLIDEQGPDDNLVPSNEPKVFNVKKVGIYNAIRWTQNTKNTNNRDVAVICKFEIFGTLFPNEICFILTFKSRFSFISIKIFTTIFLLFS